MLILTKQYADEGSVDLRKKLKENAEQVILYKEDIEKLEFKLKGRDSCIKALRIKISEMEGIERTLRHEIACLNEEINCDLIQAEVEMLKTSNQN